MSTPEFVILDLKEPTSSFVKNLHTELAVSNEIASRATVKVLEYSFYGDVGLEAIRNRSNRKLLERKTTEIERMLLKVFIGDFLGVVAEKLETHHLSVCDYFFDRFEKCGIVVLKRNNHEAA